MHQEFLTRFEKLLLDAEIETRRGSVYWRIEQFLEGKPVKRDLHNPPHITDIPLYRFSKVQMEDLIEIIGEYQKILEKLGYPSLADILTTQEHELMGSTPEVKSDSLPYTPMGILTSEISIDNVQKARRLRKYSNVYGIFFCRKDNRILVSLEPLDEDGQTIRDSVPLNKRTLEPFRHYRKSDDFPYRRE